ncbi:MAG TPA: hypothetical protein VGN34_18125, partial [Ktedonobacteraceae bacterium]
PGWWRIPPLFRPNYACSMSRGHASFLDQATTEEWKKPPSLEGVRSVTNKAIGNSAYFVYSRTYGITWIKQ